MRRPETVPEAAQCVFGGTHRLREQTRRREYAASWALQFAEVEKQRDAAAALLRDRYQPLVDELVTIMQTAAMSGAREIGSV